MGIDDHPVVGERAGGPPGGDERVVVRWRLHLENIQRRPAQLLRFDGFEHGPGIDAAAA